MGGPTLQQRAEEDISRLDAETWRELYGVPLCDALR